jgi:hypothetical protein
MPNRIAIFILVAVLLGCATHEAAQTSYNKGVDAYRVKDYVSARTHWSEAAAQGDTSALNNLGYLLYFGLGGEPDSTRAISLWKQAAVAGHSEAQWHLGQAFEEGKGLPQNLVEAYAWYRCAVVNAESAVGADKDLQEQIAGDARKSLAKLLEKLTKEQFESAERLAKQYIDKYAKNRRGT